MTYRSLALLPALLATACMTTTSTTRTWGAPAQPWVRYGTVEQIQETTTTTTGNPVGGAVAGAVIGGLLGSAIGGHTHYDRYGYGHYHASGAGALIGAAGGAMVGAAASQGGGQSRSYTVTVRYDDGGAESYVYPDSSPFGVGQRVALSPQGLSPM